MRLKSIEMRGFKSFPDKTTLNIGNGITAIIGPNGSGKSNISDAVRWVLGEMSVKSLRGNRMEDVIFNGAAGRTPSNFCSVSIILDTVEEALESSYDSGDNTDEAENKETKNAKFRLGDSKEVVITRKYYRSGESEYYINKTQVRLKDIYELFYDTGIGREGYSVIGQGKIAEVLSQKGDERRSIFEEAAGISKFRYKKTEAERKLKETENNLVRINDILNEVSSRIGPLEKEAENAKQYLVLSEEKKGLEITLWLEKIDDIKKELEKSEIEYNSGKYELERCEELVKKLESKLDSSINEGYELSKMLSETERKKSDAKQKSSGIGSKKAVLLNDIEHYKRSIVESREGLEVEKNGIMSTCSLIDEAEQTLIRLKNELDEVNEEEKAVQQKYDAKHALLASLQEKLEQANNEYSALLEKNADLLSVGARIDTTLEHIADTKSGSDKSIIASEQKINELKKRLEEIRVAETESRSKLQAHTEMRAEAEKNLSELRAKFEKAREIIVGKRMSLAADEQKREHLQRLEQLFEGYSHSVKSVISAAKQGHLKTDGRQIGIHGTVSSIISTSGDYVIALETALGFAVQYIVVDSDADAKTAIDYLKKNKLGRATFLPISTVNGKKCDVSVIKDLPGYIGIASELAEFDKKYTGVIDDLLGRTVIAGDINSAIKIAGKSKYRIRIVTCDGQVINAGGSFTGGSAAKKVGLLTRNMDIERLSEAIKQKNKSLLDSERESISVQNRIKEADKILRSEEASVSEYKAELDNILSKMTTTKVLLDEEKERLDGLLASKHIDDEKYEELLKRKQEFVDSVKQDEQKTKQLKEYLDRLKEETEKAKKEEENLYSELNRKRMALLEKRSVYGSQNEHLSLLNEKKQSHETRVIELGKLIEKSETDILTCESEISRLDSDNLSIMSEIEAQESSMQELIKHREIKEKQTNDIRQAVKTAMQEKEEAFRSFTRIDAKQSKLNDDYENISEKLWDEYELTYSSASVYRLPNEKMDKAPSRLSALKKRIRAMGSINVNAVEEYRQEKERFDFLTAQTEDLNKTRRNLDNAIMKLNAEMKQTFLDCFERINTEFGKVFAKLFGGGNAYIELTDPNLPLECGIDIILKPPGKSVRNISLLSGGEQAFAAIALYLTLQKINPAPFCIFDEIESALDDINVIRFAEYIKDHKHKTQFILITHRRGTMERADTLYGVTMRQKGISEYLELNISKLEENIKEFTD